MSIKERAARLGREIPAVFIALHHPRTPKIAKVLAWATIAYALSPLDLIPDFIPLLGYLDDLLLLPGMVALTLRLIPPDVREECREKAQALWPEGKPKKLRYAIPILVLWLAALLLVLRALDII